MTRWTEACTAILLRMVPAGYTDQEIADHIALRTGMQFERRTVMRHRQERQLGSCWQTWARRPRVHAERIARAA